MTRSLAVLDHLRIDTPCPVAWEGMPGDDRTRHCRACDHPVHDVSALTAAEAAALLVGSITPCVRVHRRADGSVVTRDSAAGRALRVRRVATRILLTAASWAGLAVFTGCREERRVMMGTPAYKIEEPAPQLPEAPPPRPVTRPPAPPAPDVSGEDRVSG